MLSSTSSSSARAWLVTWLCAIALAAASLLAVEYRWRAQGYVPNVLDSLQLWSVQRQRVYGNAPKPLVLLGASRIEYGIDLKILRDELPGYKPVMLAVNGKYPLSVLRDLAQDEAFNGVVLCDLESAAFVREYAWSQQAYPDYYHSNWTPSWHLHRLLLTDWQRTALIANPDFGWLAMLKYATLGGEPFHNYITYYANRGGDIDYRKTDPAAIKQRFADVVEGRIVRMPKPTPEEWFANLEPAFAAARAIQARGGQVIFFESPTHGLIAATNERLYPHAQFWDRFAAASPAPVLSANSIPELAVTALPDNSHVDYRDKAVYTRTLIRVLVERGLLRR